VSPIVTGPHAAPPWGAQRGHAVEPGLGSERLVCPFLRSRDGGWTSTVASRDLRCWAVHPAAQPAGQKQRQLCVVAAHDTCATFLAATFDAVAGEPEAAEELLWPAGSPVPVALESVHSRPGPTVGTPRTGGQVVLIGLMVVAFLALVIARANPLGGGSGSAPPSPTAASSLVAEASATALPSQAASASPAPPGSTAPSPSPSATASAVPASPAPSPAASSPAPSASQRTYKVRAGDTLSAIAAKFSTTVTAITKANKIADPRNIHAGQVLVIP
jgi:LysM repeat protein